MVVNKSISGQPMGLIIPTSKHLAIHLGALFELYKLAVERSLEGSIERLQSTFTSCDDSRH